MAMPNAAQPGHTHCLAQLASNAALLASGIAAQGVLTTEAWAEGTLLKWVHDLHRAGPTTRLLPWCWVTNQYQAQQDK